MARYCLNPLKSGLCLRQWFVEVNMMDVNVSIPSNRGSVSVLALNAKDAMKMAGLNPLKSGLCLRRL